MFSRCSLDFHALVFRYTSVLVPWAACALNRSCIAPLGPGGASHRGNHRQDQSALTILSHAAGMPCVDKELNAGFRLHQVLTTSLTNPSLGHITPVMYVALPLRTPLLVTSLSLTAHVLACSRVALWATLICTLFVFIYIFARRTIDGPTGHIATRFWVLLAATAALSVATATTVVAMAMVLLTVSMQTEER